MKKVKKISLWTVGVLGFLVLLLAIFLLVLPKFINIEPIHKRIMANLSREVGGHVTYQRVDLSFLPLPRMVVHGVAVSIPGKTKGSIEAATVYPKLLDLLAGRVELRGLALESPHFRVDLPERHQGEGRAPEGGGHLLAPFPLNLPVEDLALENGKLEIYRSGETLLSLQNIEAALESRDSVIRFDLSGVSNVVERFSLKGRFEPETFKGQGQIDLVRIKPQVLTQALLQDSDFRLGQSLANLKLTITMNGPEAMAGKFQGSVPSLRLNRGKGQLSVKAGSFTGSIQKAKDRTTVSLNSLTIDQPQMTLATTLVLEKTSPRIRVKVEGKGVDVPSTRKAALDFLGDEETVREIFDIVRGGQLPAVTFETGGDSAEELGELKNMVIQGRMEQGMIRVPGVGMGLTEVTGDTVISKGILKGENLGARDGKTLGRGGKIEVGLEGENAPFHLDIQLDADLAVLPLFLKKVVDSKALIKELDRIEGLSGKATGRLVLGDRLDAVTPQVDVSQFNLSAKYEPLPFALTVTGGRLVYDQAGIRLENVKAGMGKSSVSGISGRVDLGKDPSMDITYRGSTIHLGELFPWVKAQKGLWHADPKDLQSLEGLLTSTGARYRGPFSDPKSWQVALSGKLEDITLESSLLPGPMKVSQGNFRVAHRPGYQKTTLEGLQIAILDASFQASGILSDYMAGLNRVEMSVQGTVDKEVVRYVGSRFQVPPHLHVKTPITLSRSQFVWERGKQISLQGDAAVQQGPRISIDLVDKAQELNIRELRIHDEESEAGFGLNLKEDEIRARFKGHLNQKTLQGLFVEQPFPWGDIKGDVQAQVFLSAPLKSTAQGFLEGDDLIIALGLKEPVRIDRISLKARERHIDIQSAGLLYQDHQLALKGGVDFSRAGFKIDLDARAGDLDWDDLAPLLKEEQPEEAEAKKETSPQIKKEQAEKGEPKKETSRKLEVEGVVRLQAESFKYRRFVWKPLHVDITPDSGGVRIDVKEADLCGISTPGILSVKGGEISLDFRPKAENLSIGPAVSCLWGEAVRGTGTLDLHAEIRGEGTPDQLVRSLEGFINYDARNGRIYRDMVVTNILSFLNITEILRGRFPDIGEEGFAYRSITYRSRIRDGKLIVQEGVMDGEPADIVFEGNADLENLNMDLTVLVSPAKTANWIIRHTPLVGRIMGGNLITIPVRVTGPPDHVKVEPIPTTMVGGGVLDMMKRTVELPFTLIHANPSQEKK